MKIHSLLLCLVLPLAARADCTIAPDTRHAYAANCGWLDARAGTGTHGVVVGEFVCSGYLWSANAGWIRLGSGAPTNGIHYSNTTGADSGVNHLGDGRLRGLAWAANLGWVNFADTGNPRVDLVTGNLTGHAWSANVGWINLTGLRATHLAAGADTDGDGIPDAWELQHAPDLTVLGHADADGDGASDPAEYHADTNPLDPQSHLQITRISKLTNVNSVEMEWTSSPARVYDIEAKPNLTDTNWIYLGTVPGASSASNTVQAIAAGRPRPSSASA